MICMDTKRTTVYTRGEDRKLIAVLMREVKRSTRLSVSFSTLVRMALHALSREMGL